MSELEDMGYLEKPHTSAGRIPSPQGYRLYVDELMERPADNAEDGNALQNSVLTKVRELDHLIQEAGKLLTSLTNYASVAITPAMTQIAIRQFEIIAVDKMNFVIVVVTDSGTVKNKMVRTVAEVSKDEAELLTYVLNQTLTGLPLSSITAERFDIVRRAAGLTALLDYMEDDRKHLLPATRKIDGIQFFIGPENGENPLSETSAIYAKYDIGKIGQGAIGIVGPTRMDYAKLSAQLSRFAKGLNKLIAETFLDEKDGNH